MVPISALKGAPAPRKSFFTVAVNAILPHHIHLS